MPIRGRRKKWKEGEKVWEGERDKTHKNEKQKR